MQTKQAEKLQVVRLDEGRYRLLAHPRIPERVLFANHIPHSADGEGFPENLWRELLAARNRMGPRPADLDDKIDPTSGHVEKPLSNLQLGSIQPQLARDLLADLQAA